MQQQLKRNQRGLKSDDALLRIIIEQPGLSQYELTKKLIWPSGRVDGSIRRLINANQIIVRVLERNGRRVNLVYPKGNKPSDSIEVPVKLLQKDEATWQDCAFVYALDSTTIGVSGRLMPEWAKISCFTEEIPIHRNEGKMVLQVPEKFRRFYGLERKHMVSSVNGNNILITVSGNIIEEKKYPA